mmetsp:Transcript_26723/g.30016  ORF Transcript_26723/g.30016 Transcript_26723/m.30016 type:complete len:92 (-) Transcript_26723:41-316(-)
MREVCNDTPTTAASNNSCTTATTWRSNLLVDMNGSESTGEGNTENKSTTITTINGNNNSDDAVMTLSTEVEAEAKAKAETGVLLTRKIEIK